MATPLPEENDTSKSSSFVSPSSYSLKFDLPCWGNTLINRDRETIKSKARIPHSLGLYNLNSVINDTDVKYPENRFCNFVKEKYKEFILDAWKVCPKNVIVSFNNLAPFLASTTIYPDFSIESAYDKLGTLPLLLVEIVSQDNFLSTAAKSVSNLIDQLRCLRNFLNLASVIGYVIPSTKSTCAMAIEVSWENLQFRTKFTHLELNDFENHFGNSLQKQCGELHKELSDPSLNSIVTTWLLSHETIFKRYYFMKLYSKDLRFVETSLKLQPDTVEECRSKFSILTRDNLYYYKIIPLRTEIFFGAYVDHKFDNSSSIVWPLHQFGIRPQFTRVFQFVRLPHKPLRRSEALKCLGQLMSQTLAALDELHNLGYVHCDVRLPNICFNLLGEVRLIDLDRIQPSGGYIQIDMKQLGVMFLCIINGISFDEELSDREYTDLCLQLGLENTIVEKLILTQDRDPVLLDCFITSYPGSILDVLNTRN